MKHMIFAAAAAATMLVAGAAQADPVQFATYGQNNTTNTIGFDNNAAGMGGTLHSINVGANSPMVDFWFTDTTNLPPVLTGHLQAYFTLNAVSNTNAEVSGNRVTQSFQTGMLSFVLPSSAGVGAAPGTNLLSINFTNMDLNGRLNSTSASTDAAWDLVTNAGSSLILTSDFFDFSHLTASDFSFSLSALSPALTLATNNSINSFGAGSSGVFSSDPAPTYVPEPGMLGLFGAGAFGLAFARRRKN